MPRQAQELLQFGSEAVMLPTHRAMVTLVRVTPTSGTLGAGIGGLSFGRTCDKDQARTLRRESDS